MQNRDPPTPWPCANVHYPNRRCDLHRILQDPELVHINRSPPGAQVRVAYKQNKEPAKRPGIEQRNLGTGCKCNARMQAPQPDQTDP
jgi:hypothetical protein